jgi:hypothetical protein
MSSLSLNKLKNQIGFVKPFVSPPVTVGINYSPCCNKSPPQVNQITTPNESDRILKEINQCLLLPINPDVSSQTAGSVAQKTNVAASTTTAQFIDAIILASVSPTDPTTRFSAFFPAPIPPPRYLQPGFVKYNYNANAPKYRVPPCVGYGWAKEAK